MRTIGIRATPSEVYFAIVENENGKNNILNIEKILIPLSLAIPDKLNYLRKTLIDIINQYNVTAAGIKITEGNAPKLSIERISLEAVIQELFSSCSVEKYFGGNISRISSLLKIPNNGDFKKFVKGEKTPDDLPFFDKISEHQREAVLTALAAQNL